MQSPALRLRSFQRLVISSASTIPPPLQRWSVHFWTVTVSCRERRQEMPRSALRLGCALLWMAFALPTAIAQPTGFLADYFRGKTIRLNIATASGGAYGAYALVFAQYYGRHIPGEP